MTLPRAVAADRASWAVLAGACLLELAVHLALVTRYGYHGDELYFLDCGRHLAFGYVDHPPLVPWLARVSEEVGGGLWALRLPAIAAGSATLALTWLIVRELGGGWRAQLLALTALLIAPAQLRIRAMLNIPVVEVMLCTLTAFLVTRAVSRRGRWLWVLAGGTLGLAVLAKHTALFWGAALALGLLGTYGTSVFASRWPWLGALVAATLSLPNLLWQMDNDFATVEFMRRLRAQVLEVQGRALFAAGQVLYFHPLAVPIWGAGVWSGLRRGPSVVRPFALQFALLLCLFLVVGGKPYYLASAYPPMLAAGGVALEAWLGSRVRLRRAFVTALTATGAAFGVLTLPILPLQRVDAVLGVVLGCVVPPMALTHDLHGMLGWREHAAVVDAVFRSLPEEDARKATVIAGSYSQAGAINQFRASSTPRAVSGHMTYYLWGPEPGRGDVAIAYGVPRQLLERRYENCQERGRIDAPLARPGDANLPVYLCDTPRQSMAAWWPKLRRYGHQPLVVEQNAVTPSQRPDMARGLAAPTLSPAAPAPPTSAQRTEARSPSPALPGEPRSSPATAAPDL